MNPLRTNILGDPLSALEIKHPTDYAGVYAEDTGEYYIPPIDLASLCKLTKAHPVHGTLPSFTANMLMKYFMPNPILKRGELEQIALDYRTMGNAYAQLIRNKMGRIIAIKHIPAVNMRKLVKQGFGWLAKEQTNLGLTPKLYKLKPNEVFHFKDYDPEQSIYGIPYWFGAVQSLLLGEDATLFHRRFFKNGAHMGYLIATSGLDDKEQDAVEEMFEESKGAGNGQTGHIGLPEGDVEKRIKIIPIGESKNIKFDKFIEISDEMVLKAWRVQPQLAGMMPKSLGGSGDLDKIIRMNYENEVIPYQLDIQKINDILPKENHIKFDEPAFNIK